MALKFFDKLSQNFIELLNDKNDYNVIIEIENNEKSFTAHSNILKYRSSYFRRELENNVKTITEYIYDVIVNLENVETIFIFDLMLAANEFELEELTNKLETHLVDTKASWLKSYLSLVYRTIFSKNNFKKLENFCNDFIIKYGAESLKTSNYLKVKIWDYVIKWGISQNSTLPNNLDEWTQENFLTLKTTLQQCLPYIRYFHLSVDEVLDSIKPYKKILDELLWDEINQHLLSPERPVKLIILPARIVLATSYKIPPRVEEPKESFSTIISDEQAAEISTWIDRKTTIYSSWYKERVWG
ncbi:hypothetical protein Glove_811494g3 [Diversispora epigaea]|uniref:BTB domain-containing protein n=1 Tax=Diversispora epigaea TaxID=1348612 RepID=A0A397G1W4_9GLOM|nr:hypothetical protein Glove_811494g3 [Diversispora epigaea]